MLLDALAELRDLVPGSCTSDELKGVLGVIGRGRSWLDGIEAQVLQELRRRKGPSNDPAGEARPGRQIAKPAPGPAAPTNSRTCPAPSTPSPAAISPASTPM